VTFGSLFAGIGGIDLGLERAGMTCKWQVEIDPWCRQVLAKHWPDVRRYEDVSAVGGHTLEPVELIAGGFPCQDVSTAGQKAGIKDGNRSGLWSEFHRIIRELRPRYVLVENVSGLLARGMGRVLGDLSTIGYDAEWEVLSAADVGAPHLRKRIFITAHNRISDASGDELRVVRERGGREHTNSASSISGNDGEEEQVADAQDSGLEGSNQAFANNEKTGRGRHSQSARGIARKQEDVADAFCDAGKQHGINGRMGRQQKLGQDDKPRISHWTTEPDVGRVANGVPQRVDRLKGLGNAVVPQCAEQIGRRIMEQRGH